MVGHRDIFTPPKAPHRIRALVAPASTPARACGPGTHRLHGAQRLRIGGWPHYLHQDTRGRVALWHLTSQGWGLGVVVAAGAGWGETAAGVRVRLEVRAGSAGPGCWYELEVG